MAMLCYKQIFHRKVTFDTLYTNSQLEFTLEPIIYPQNVLKPLANIEQALS